MSGLDNLKARLNYRGGAKQEDRMVADKLQSLRKALLYSYQAATAVLHDGREFRCLINPNKLTMELDDKVLSIPFEDICLNKPRNEEDGRTSQSLEKIGVKPGDIITWKETDTQWLIYSHYLQEDAYFRGAMRQCNAEAELEDGSKHWVYIKGPDEKSIDWKNKGFYFNSLNYTLEMYISNNEKTNEFFHRFKKLKVQGKPWEVQAVDNMTTEGIIAVYLKEDFTNEFAETQVKDPQPEDDSTVEQVSPHIEGPAEVYPFDIQEYSIVNATGGSWALNNNRARILQQSETSVTVEITTGKSGSVSLIYKTGADEIVLDITILSI